MYYQSKLQKEEVQVKFEVKYDKERSKRKEFER